MTNGFEPKIVGIFCNWCSYAGADLAGISRLKYPANIRIIRVMCSGRVEPAFVLKAFQQGADGVLVSGCHPGDCHYMEGNYKMARRNVFIEELLASFGIEKGRYRQTWISASEGEIFAQVVREMVEEVRKLGPFPGLGARLKELAAAEGGK
jgi:F420-non-reducing hydrogenase iron-sulfur subunit